MFTIIIEHSSDKDKCRISKKFSSKKKAKECLIRLLNIHRGYIFHLIKIVFCNNTRKFNIVSSIKGEI